MVFLNGGMELVINFDYSELTSYFKGVYHYQGRPLDFTIVKTIDLETKEVIDLMVSFNKKVDNERYIKDEIIKEFNKRFK